MFLTLNIAWELEARSVAEAVHRGNCSFVSGVVTNNEPKDGGGSMAFTVGSTTFRYDTHSAGLNQQLCDEIDICVGQMARLCLVDGHIGQIELLRDSNVGTPVSAWR
jgi:hypothetical protein